MTLSSRSAGAEACCQQGHLTPSSSGLPLVSSPPPRLLLAKGNHEGPTHREEAADGGLLNFLVTSSSSAGDGTKVEDKGIRQVGDD